MKNIIFLVLLVGVIIFITGCDKDQVVNESPRGVETVSDDLDEPRSIISDLPNEDCVAEKETCDGKDNDCDNKVDEDPFLCSFGKACASGRCVSCPLGGKQSEKCDGKDNDCDGLIDENLRDGCGKCITSNDPKILNRELCDGIDNDCDGSIDEEEYNDCNYFVCQTGASSDRCDRNVRYVCIDKECKSTKVCEDENYCYWDWVDKEGKQGVVGMADIRIWGGPEVNGQQRYVCGSFEGSDSEVMGGCDGSGCITQICKGGTICPSACFVKLDDSLRRVQACSQYRNINVLCSS